MTNAHTATPPNLAPPRSRQRGFTLVEVVTAMAILGVIMTIGGSALFQVMRGKQALDDERDLRAISTSLLSRFVRELQLADPGVNLLPPPGDPTFRYPPRTTFLHELKTLRDGRRGDSITFMANGAGQYLSDGSGNSGLVQIRYRVEEDPEGPQGVPDAPFILVRDETPNLRPFEKALQRTMTFPIAKNIVSLEYFFFDERSEEWVDTWGSGNRQLNPRLVRFTIVMQSPRGKRESFTTVVALSG